MIPDKLRTTMLAGVVHQFLYVIPDKLRITLLAGVVHQFSPCDTG